MSEYQLLQKRLCECGGKPSTQTNIPSCMNCSGSGYNLFPVDFDEVLLSRLAKLRFAIDGVPSDKFEVMRFEGDEG